MCDLKKELIAKAKEMFQKKTCHSSKSKKTQPPPPSAAFVLTETYKKEVANHSYLGKKGYTISKKILNPEDLQSLKRDLLLTPETNNMYACQKTEVKIPVFRENENKIYIPRFYGIEKYGLPPKCEIGNNTKKIHLEFVHPLREMQEKIVNIYLNHVSQPICENSSRLGGGGILEVYTGAGKTVMALKILSELKEKTCIIVNKEFLANQWICRIKEFLPNATIGRIQGPIFDTENKDIVVGMLQTLYERNFPENAFDDFGLTIIDEVQFIGSACFSKALLKIITPFMLGISATVDRKDNMTQILNMFIGNKIHSEQRKQEDVVCVRGIEYISSDEEFNQPIFNYKGDVMYSSLITKLCDFSHRSDFIVRVIKDLIQEKPHQQMMILCHNRSLLTYLYNSIVHNNIATVGYYVGKMKEAELQETETKTIVLATYQMASVGLDIKTLSTLILATPKTDVVQSVGRILRIQHEHPIIVDIIDKHQIFKNQFVKRRKYYEQCNYRIRTIKSPFYDGFDFSTNHSWKLVHEPKTMEELKLKSTSNDEDPPLPLPIRTCFIQLTDAERSSSLNDDTI